MDLCKNEKFDDSDVELFLTQENLIPLKIQIEDKIIGFIFLVKGKTVDYVINDMFILRKYRNKGLGKKVIAKLFALYKG